MIAANHAPSTVPLTFNLTSREEAPVAMHLLNRNARRPKKLQVHSIQLLVMLMAGKPWQTSMFASPSPSETTWRQKGIEK
ncbi:hypothetical protein PsorP6_000288 [Peronosclerospora sorghi]|uniref:Uncharacterized protein n=1 Tax=Peronosclerospora sorghi TaxID=230839 RepID=A0ACC0WS44_9STRA|nr:hypothetical protein PsorP6_000288 [Peronosclerospora sorghi]